MFASGKNPYDSAHSVGGAETSMRQIADTLSRRGHMVTYVALGGSKRAIDEARLSGVRLVVLPIPLNRIGLVLGAPLMFIVLPFLVAVRKIDSVYVFYEPYWLAATYLLARWCPSIKVTIRIAGPSWNRFVEHPGWRRLIFKGAFARATCLNYIHEDLVPITEAICRNAGIDIQDKPFFIGDIGVPVSELVGSRPLRGVIPGRKIFVVLVPTRFSSYQKRQDLIIDAARQLPADTLIEIRFAGDGVLQDAMKQLAQKHLHAGQYTFLGFLPQEQVWDEIRQADVVALPTEYEGLGKVVLEAMAIGTPVVVSDVVSLNSYIQDRENGFLVPNTAKSWAEVLGSLPERRAELIRVAKAAQHFVKTFYSAQANIAIFEKNLCG